MSWRFGFTALFAAFSFTVSISVALIAMLTAPPSSPEQSEYIATMILVSGVSLGTGVFLILVALRGMLSDLDSNIAELVKGGSS